VSSSAIGLNWSAVTPPANCTISSYTVYGGTTANPTTVIASGVTSTSYTNSGLAASTTYYYVVKAVDADGASAASAQASATTQSGGGSCTAVPSAPTGLTATASSSSAIGLGWTAVTPPANCTISSYSVYGGTTANPTTLIAGGLTGTTYSNTGLSASTTYYYVVKALDADGTSAASAQATATTQAAGSGTSIVSINAGGPAESNSGGGDNSFVADEDFSAGGTTYAVTNTITIPAGVTTAAPAAVYQSARQGTVTYTIPGLTAGTGYTVRLHFAELYFSAAGARVFNVAINGTAVLTNFDIYAMAKANFTAVVEQFTATANSSGDIVIAFTNGTVNQPMFNGIEVLGSSTGCTTVPSAPTGLAATASSSSVIGLTWTAVTPPANCTISSYSVYRSTTSGFTPGSGNLVASGLTSPSYSNTGLAASTTYYYKVEALDADGTSAASAQATATTQAGASCTTVPSAPTGLAATASSSSVIGLTWTAVTPPANCTISSYSVYRSTTSGFTPGSGTLVASGLTTASYSNTGLAASTTYYFVVEALDADGTSAASAQATATTQAASGAHIVSINAGGPAESNSGGGDNSFVADEDYNATTTTYAVTNTISTTAAGANAAPMAVYQSARQGTVTYTIPGLTAGTSYPVRLHFAELYFSAAGDRVFNVAINGTTVLTNFDIVKTAGANYTAVVENFTATANSSGDIVITFTNGTKDQPMINGVEIL
jgi:fibronectin type 3 domain-containing protein